MGRKPLENAEAKRTISVNDSMWRYLKKIKLNPGEPMHKVVWRLANYYNTKLEDIVEESEQRLRNMRALQEELKQKTQELEKIKKFHKHTEEGLRQFA